MSLPLKNHAEATMSQRAQVLTPLQRAQAIYEERHTPQFWLEKVLDNPKGVVFLLVFHALLGVIYRDVSNYLGAFHVILVLVIGLLWALSSRYPIRYAAYAAAYIAGAEVLWRQNGIPVFWEAGKYFSMLILGIAILRSRTAKVPTAPLVLLLCLLPGIGYTLIQSPQSAHSLLSSSLSGPVALVVILFFFANIQLTRDDLRRIFLLLAIPTMGIAAVIVYQLQTQTIVWAVDSNNDVSGFGANQVSTALGLGWTGLLLTLFFLVKRKEAGWIFVLVPTIFISVILNFLTFSRGGLVSSMVAAFMALLVMLAIPKKRILVINTVIVGVIFFVIIFPLVDRFTEGSLSKRYQFQTDSIDTTSRDFVFSNDLEIFASNPVMGVGAGKSKPVRLEMTGISIATHTEFSRLLAEHGVLGIVANIAMIVIALQAFIKQKTWAGRAIALALVIWAFFYMSQTGTRTVGYALALGIAYSQSLLGDDSESDPQSDEKSTSTPKVPKPRTVPFTYPVLPGAPLNRVNSAAPANEAPISGTNR